MYKQNSSKELRFVLGNTMTVVIANSKSVKVHASTLQAAQNTQCRILTCTICHRKNMSEELPLRK